MGRRFLERGADAIETCAWHGRALEVRIWTEPTDIVWDGEGEAPEGGGWDIFIEVSVTIEGFTFSGSSALCSNWGDSSFIQDTISEDVFPEAVKDLERAIARIAAGVEVSELENMLMRAKRERGVALWTTGLMRKHPQRIERLWERTAEAMEANVEATKYMNTTLDKTIAELDGIGVRRCGKCNACEIERIGCGCDGSLDDGCFLCEPERHQRPTCPRGNDE